MITRHRFAGLLLSTLMLCSGAATAAQTPGKVIAPLRGVIDQVSDTSLPDLTALNRKLFMQG